MALWTTLPEDLGPSQSCVVQVANGQQHALLLTDEGVVYSWGGKNDHGQLGRSGLDKVPAPIVETIRDEVIVQIACGLNHSLALSQHGAVFAWGHNKAGQIGTEGLRPKTKAKESNTKELDVKKPVRVKGLSGSLVKSISCGPESSACVTVEGEVYVWGALCYYLTQGRAAGGDGAGEAARSTNFTVPVCLRGVPDICKPLSQKEGETPCVPGRIAVYKDTVMCTVVPEKHQDDMADLIKAWKQRSAQLSHLVKSAMSDDDQHAAIRGAAAGEDPQDLKSLVKELRSHKRQVDEQINRINRDLAKVTSEHARVSRELTILLQQDTALEEFTNNLEVKREGQASSRALETQLNDVDYFRNSNKRSKLNFYEQREALDRQKLQLDQELSQANQYRQQIEGQEKLIQALRAGGTAGHRSSDSGIKLAAGKCDELASTDPATLAGRGSFGGFGEVLTTCERSLRDVSSSLKEVGAATSSNDSFLEGLLEMNLRMRKECLELVHRRLELAEHGQRGGCPGMAGFFDETSRHWSSKPQNSGDKKKKKGPGGLPTLNQSPGDFFGQLLGMKPKPASG